MDTTKHNPTATEPQTRSGRGLALYRERGEEIVPVRGTVYSVPSCSGGEVPYLVEAVSGTCTCPDLPPAGELCKHATAVLLKGAKEREERRESVHNPHTNSLRGVMRDAGKIAAGLDRMGS